MKDTVVQQPNVSIDRSHTQALSDLTIADAVKMPSFSAILDFGYRCGIFFNSNPSPDNNRFYPTPLRVLISTYFTFTTRTVLSRNTHLSYFY